MRPTSRGALAQLKNASISAAGRIFLGAPAGSNARISASAFSPSRRARYCRRISGRVSAKRRRAATTPRALERRRLKGGTHDGEGGRFT